jgi:hypothetical protein
VRHSGPIAAICERRRERFAAAQAHPESCKANGLLHGRDEFNDCGLSLHPLDEIVLCLTGFGQPDRIHSAVLGTVNHRGPIHLRYIEFPDGRKVDLPADLAARTKSRSEAGRRRNPARKQL